MDKDALLSRLVCPEVVEGLTAAEIEATRLFLDLDPLGMSRRLSRLLERRVREVSDAV